MTQTIQPTQAQSTQTPATGTQLLEKILIQLEHQTDELDGIATRLDNLHEAICIGGASGNGSIPTNGSSPDNNDNLVEFDASEIITTMDDSGAKKLFRIKGGQFSTYGLRVWPEILETFGYDPEEMDLGSTPFTERVVARVGDKGKKVIALAGGAS